MRYINFIVLIYKHKLRKFKKKCCLVVWQFLYVNLKISVNTGLLSVKFFQSRYLLNKYTLSSLLGSVQFSSVAQSCPTLCDPMNHSTPGFSVHHQLPEFTQTRVHQVSEAIQPSHPQSSPSPPAPNPSQHQSLFQ